MDPINPSLPASHSPSPLEAQRRPLRQYKGEVVYIYAFDVGYELDEQAITSLMGQPVSQVSIDASKRSPRTPFFYRSRTVRLSEVEHAGPRGLLRIQRSVNIFDIGAISITIRIPFEVNGIADLVPYHDLRFSDGRHLHEIVRQLAEQIREELRSYVVRPNAALSDEEAYTVFCFNAPLNAPEGKAKSAERWLGENRRDIAALLTEELAAENLSQQEAEETTSRYLSYYDADLVVVDWDAAMIVDEPKHRDEIIYIMELANLQLAELEAYDRLLDAAVERAYRDVAAKGVKRLYSERMRREFQALRVDMARITDELSNITKFFGDWHLARIYQMLGARFHLSDWHHTVEDKLKTLDEIYQLIRAEQTNRWMLILEATIVLLFVADLVMIVFLK